MRADIYIHIFLTHIPHASRRAHRHRSIDERSDPIRSTTRYPIAIVVVNPSSIHRSDVTRIIRTANKLNASRRLDASAALACTVVFAARVAACARRDLSAARAFSLAVKQEDKVTVDDITSAGMTGESRDRPVVDEIATHTHPHPPTHVVVIGGSCVRGFRTSGGHRRRSSSSSSRAIPTRGGGRVCVYPWVHTDTIIIIIMHRHSSSSLR